jgi:hypothetical protein
MREQALDFTAAAADDFRGNQQSLARATAQTDVKSCVPG